ncbi:T6SS effector BTH_I2691 family protein [Halomonas sp. H5]|uniref:T6SS effector BTH_I2691 family protein n=1 Tax=Halomonas sp. H5 TaxID=3423910 RepID=UPI003D359B6B
MSDRQAQQDARDAEFDETPFGATGVCPLYLESAIFPVRYAIDEAASEREVAQGPHPLTEPWEQHGYPELQTRSYCLRQLRDGWLYVWDEVDRTFHEYRIEGHQFTRIPWPEDINVTQPDERQGDGESKPYLLYPCRSRIWLAYSPAQWTWRICEHMRSNVDSRRRFMRSLDIRSAVEAPEHTAHVGPLSELGQHLADITPQGATRDFDSTTVMTRALTQEEREGEGETEYVALASKPEIDQNAVLAQVPDKDEALFVALDDPLGVVNDLTMNLLGVEMASEQFEDEHGHQLQTARVVQELGLVDIDDLIDPEVRHDPERYRDAIIKTGELLDVLASMDAGSDHTLVAKEMHARRLREELHELGMPNPPGRNSSQYEAWHAKEQPRLDVRLDEVIDYLAEHGPRHERLRAHCQRSREDLITWLDRLPTSAQALCFDGCNALQTQALIEFTRMVSEALGASEEGQQWLTERARRRDNLVGLALFNFSPELEQALTEIAKNFIETGEADGLEVSDLTSYASRANEIKAVLDLEHVRSSKAFQALAPHVQKFLDTLATAVQGPAKLAWEGLAYQLLPAVGAGATVTIERLARGLSQTMQAAFMHPDNAARNTQLVRDGDYEARHRRWRRDVVRLQNRIRGLRATLSRPATPHDRSAQIRDLNGRQQDLDELMTREPKRFVARQGGSSGGPAETLGFDELHEQRRLKLQEGAAAARARMQGWMTRYGGGLPLLVAGLNLLNVGATLSTIEREGMDDNARQSLISGLGYTTSAVMALWVMPYWQKHASLMAPIENVPTKLANAGIRIWDGSNAVFARTAAKLATRVAGMAIFGTIGAAAESLQIYGQFDSATSAEERLALGVKLTSTVAMGLVSGAQLLGASAGYLWSFAWIMASWAIWTLAIAGVVYLFASYFANRYHREGIRLWLYRSGWGKSPRWSNDDEGRTTEWRALLETLYQPTVRLEPVTRLGYQGPRAVNVHQGFWLKIALPSMLAGETLQLSRNASQGFWAPASSLEERSDQSSGELPASADYGPQETRVWQAWLPADAQAPDAPFALSIDYPEMLLSSPHSADYVFSKPQADEGTFDLEPGGNAEICQPISHLFSLTVPA